MDWLQLLNLLLVPVTGAVWWMVVAVYRLVRVVEEVPIIKQRVARLEKRCFNIDGLPADQS